MLDPLTIVEMAAQHFASPVKDLQHLNLMITAGPTREPLDPVRYISNHSSGKMGFAIAAAAAQRGANVTGSADRYHFRHRPLCSVLMSLPRWKWKRPSVPALNSSTFLLAAPRWRITARPPSPKIK